MGSDTQRGDGTYEKSIRAIQRLNEAGYGQGDPDRVLTLVTNPVGAFLAGSQASLEAERKGALERDHGVTFDRLFALTNVPMSCYLESYRRRLVGAFNPATVGGPMCRGTVSVSGDGRLFDCDFNQPLEVGAVGVDGAALLRVHGRGRLLLRRRHDLSGPLSPT